MKIQIKSSLYFDLILLFCTSVVSRIVYILTYGLWEGGDTPDYIETARNLVFNHAFAYTNSDGTLHYTAFRTVTYPALIALFWTGDEPPINLVVAIQVILGSLTVVATYLIARKHFYRGIAIVSALLFALSPIAIKYTGVILTESLFTFLLVAACYFWGNKMSKAAGLLFGLASLTRPIIFPFLLLLPLISFFPSFRRMRRSLFTITVISTLVTVPWIARNSLLFGQPTLSLSSGYGTNLLQGTVETPLYGDNLWPFTNLPLTQNVEGLNEVEQDRRKTKLAVNRIAENPFGWLKVRVKQYPRLFFESGESILGGLQLPPMSQAIDESNLPVIFIKVSVFSACAFLFLLFFLGFAGFIKYYPNLLYVYPLPIFFMLIHLPMWTEARYLLPVMPFIYIVAVYGFVMLNDYFDNPMGRVKSFLLPTHGSGPKSNDHVLS
jgi:4-amino-4-deoxy-L-arabinose transferase-like glycosyltransferase